MSITNTIEIGAPAGAVWELTADVARWPALLPATVQAVEAEPGWLHLGGRARIKQPAQPWRTWTVTELAPQHRLVWATPSVGGQMIATHDLRATADGHTLNTLTIELTGRLARLRERLARRPVARALAIENAAFKQHAEAATAPPATVPPTTVDPATR